MPKVRFVALEIFSGRGIDVQVERFSLEQYHESLLEFLRSDMTHPCAAVNDLDAVAIRSKAIEEITFRRLQEGTLSASGMLTIEDEDGCGFYDFCLITDANERWKPTCPVVSPN